MGTVAGALVTCDGRSPFCGSNAGIGCEIDLWWVNSRSNVSLGRLPPLAPRTSQGKLITRIEIPLQTKLSFKTVARSPADKPIVCAALAQWPSGRTRLVIGGWGKAPTLAMDGNEASGIKSAARNAAHDATDEWATLEYRSDIAAVLAKRCLEEINIKIN